MQKTGEMVLINDALAEIDVRLSKNPELASRLTQAEAAIAAAAAGEAALGDQLRAELQEELEHVEVTLREEFVAVQLQVDTLGREVSRLRSD